MNQTSQSSLKINQDANNFCKRKLKNVKAPQIEKVWGEIIWINQLKNIYAQVYEPVHVNEQSKEPQIIRCERTAI